ncbi:MAG: MlaD family protein [Streptosporangiaceae bacterium]
MVTLRTRLKNIGFAIIGICAIAFIGTNYADLGRFVGLRGYYVVKVDLAQGGGLLPNADVTYRGVSVGRVGPMRLTADGVMADLHIKNDSPRIPATLQAIVASRSAVGEQYIDLQPSAQGGPYLAEGQVVPRTATHTPAQVTELLVSLNDFSSSVPLDALRTVVDELGTAFAGQGPDLGSLLDDGSEFVHAADENVGVTTRLIRNTNAVLATQNQEADSLLAFGRNARLLAAQLRSSDPDIRRLIAAAPGASEQFAGLLRDLDPSLSVLVANLLTTSDVLLTRTRGMEQLLVKAPAAVAAGSSVVGSGKLNLGLVTTFFNPLPCTRGYGGTTYRNGLDLSRGPALNTAARCTMAPSTGVNVRGAANAPHPAVPRPARPGSTGENNLPGLGLPGALGLPGVDQGPADLGGLLGLTR